jgi:hypothetical protein
MGSLWREVRRLDAGVTCSAGSQGAYLLRTLLREGFLVSRTHLPELESIGLLYRAHLH